MKNIFLAIITLFVAVDAIGLLPLYISLTNGLNTIEKKRIIFRSMVTAVCLAVLFVFAGKIVFDYLGISIGDFMVAGGLILFCIAIMDILQAQKESRIHSDDLGVVPLGTPLVAGPAVMTALLIIIQQYGLKATMVSIIFNIVLAGLIFRMEVLIIKLIGESGARALSKITSLLLGAFAISMVRRGIEYIIKCGFGK